MAALRATVSVLFVAAECDSSAVSDLLGAGGVTPANVMQYLGIVEQKMNQLVQVIVCDTLTRNVF